MEERRLRVTVVMAAYNAQKYIGYAVDSVLKQTMPELELIVVDDASADETYELVRKKAETDRRIRLYRNQQNRGASYSRNRAVDLARGEWIAFLDADDLWEKRKLEMQLEFAEEKRASFTFTGSSFMDGGGNRLDGVLHVPEHVSYEELLKQNVISCSSVLLRRSLLAGKRMQSGNFHEDYLLWLTLLREGAEAYGLDIPLLVYRMSSGSKSGNKRKAAAMTFRVYRKLDLSMYRAVRSWLHYAWRSMKKYKAIGSSGQTPERRAIERE